MKTPIHFLFIQLFLIIVLLISSISIFSQNKEVLVELKASKKQFPSYIEVPNKGVIVIYPNVFKTTYNTVIFFDENLEKKWEIAEIGSYETSLRYDILYVNSDEEPYLRASNGVNNQANNCVVSPSGEFAYITNTVKDEVYRIDIKTGKWISLPLDHKFQKKFKYPNEDEYMVKFFVDETYYYIIELNKFKTSTSSKEKGSLTVNRIKHNETKFDFFSFIPIPPNGNEKPRYQTIDPKSMSNIYQHWNILFIKENTVGLIDNFIYTDENNANFEKTVLYSLDGKKVKEVMLSLGFEKTKNYIPLNYVNATVYYDNRTNRIYTASINEDEQKIHYKCYDLKLQLLWDKEYSHKMDKIKKNESKFIYMAKSIDNGLIINMKMGDLYINKDGENPVLTDDCLSKNPNYEKYGGDEIDCYAYEKYIKIKGVKETVTKDLGEFNKNWHKSDFQFLEINDKIIYTNSIGEKVEIYRLASFSK